MYSNHSCDRAYFPLFYSILESVVDFNFEWNSIVRNKLTSVLLRTPGIDKSRPPISCLPHFPSLIPYKHSPSADPAAMRFLFVALAVLSCMVAAMVEAAAVDMPQVRIRWVNETERTYAVDCCCCCIHL